MAIFGLASWCLWDRDVAQVEDANLLFDAATKIHRTLVSGGLDLFEEPSPFVIAALKAAKSGLEAGRGAEVVNLLDLLDPKPLGGQAAGRRTRTGWGGVGGAFICPKPRRISPPVAIDRLEWGVGAGHVGPENSVGGAG